MTLDTTQLDALETILHYTRQLRDVAEDIRDGYTESCALDIEEGTQRILFQLEVIVARGFC